MPPLFFSRRCCRSSRKRAAEAETGTLSMTINSASLNMGQCAHGSAAVWPFSTKARWSCGERGAVVRHDAPLHPLAIDRVVCIRRSSKLRARRDTPDDGSQHEDLFFGMLRTRKRGTWEKVMQDKH